MIEGDADHIMPQQQQQPLLAIRRISNMPPSSMLGMAQQQQQPPPPPCHAASSFHLDSTGNGAKRAFDFSQAESQGGADVNRQLCAVKVLRD